MDCLIGEVSLDLEDVPIIGWQAHSRNGHNELSMGPVSWGKRTCESMSVWTVNIEAVVGTSNFSRITN